MEAGFLGVPDVDGLIFFGLSVASLFTAFIVAVTGSAGGLLLLGTLALVFPPAVLIPIHTVVLVGDIRDNLEVIVELISTDAVQVDPGDPVIIRNWGGDRDLQSYLPSDRDHGVSGDAGGA